MGLLYNELWIAAKLFPGTTRPLVPVKLSVKMLTVLGESLSIHEYRDQRMIESDESDFAILRHAATWLVKC